jgi:hypothetical protein
MFEELGCESAIYASVMGGMLDNSMGLAAILALTSTGFSVFGQTFSLTLPYFGKHSFKRKKYTPFRRLPLRCLIG